MSAVGILDTSVFCSILRVPGKDQHHAEALDQLRSLLSDRCTLVLPLATIYETGNHVAQNGDGATRRRTATVFVSQVQQAFSGEAPFTPTPLHAAEEAEFVQWLAEFPDCAMRGTGLGDLSIIKVWERQCRLNPARRVFIWSYDRHLRGFDRAPRL